MNPSLSLKSAVKAKLSLPRDSKSSLKEVKIAWIQEKAFFQFSLQRGEKVFHENLKGEAAEGRLQELLPLFRQMHLSYPEEELHFLTNRRGEWKEVGRIKSSTSPAIKHNREKPYPFPEGVHHPFLQALGIQDSQGKIPYSQRDKFVQVNQFITVSAPLLSQLKGPKIVDLGCGKGYLTLALYAYYQGRCEIVGVDRKKEVMESQNLLVKKLGWQGISFITGDIASFSPPFPPDLVVALHACDQATDLAIEKGILWKATGLLMAPCCQQELLKTLPKGDFAPMLRWGAIGEKFAALLTDAYRGEILSALGYETDVVEFVDPDHTPKNLLIRALRKGLPSEPLLQKLRESPLDFRLLRSLRAKEL